MPDLIKLVLFLLVVLILCRPLAHCDETQMKKSAGVQCTDGSKFFAYKGKMYSCIEVGAK